MTRSTCSRSVDRLHLSKNCVFVDIFTVCRGSGQKLPKIYHDLECVDIPNVCLNLTYCQQFAQHDLIDILPDLSTGCMCPRTVNMSTHLQYVTDQVRSYPYTCCTGQTWTTVSTRPRRVWTHSVIRHTRHIATSVDRLHTSTYRV